LSGPNYQHILITGGAGGIGRSMAARFLREGCKVTLVDRNRDALERIRGECPQIEVAAIDITDTPTLRRLVDDLGPRADGPDVIINSAGIHCSAPLTSPDYAIGDQLADIEREVRTNFVALAQHCALWRPHLETRVNGAAIVNLASALAFVPKYSSAVYCATKAAVHQFSRIFAMQLAGTNVRVVTVYPPLVASAMTAGRNSGAMSAEEFVARFYGEFRKGIRNIHIGESKWLYLANRISPFLAARFIERD
jgi:uncharacterized oxidoreductase